MARTEAKPRTSRSPYPSSLLSNTKPSLFGAIAARSNFGTIRGWAMDPDSVRFEYFRLGTSYYVSGRFAHYANEVPVAGTFFTTAVEMLLKGCLVGIVPLPSRRSQTRFVHRIRSFCIPPSSPDSIFRPMAVRHVHCLPEPLG